MRHCLPDRYEKFQASLAGVHLSGSNKAQQNAFLRFIKSISKKLLKGTSGGFVNSVNKTFSALEYAEEDEKLIEIFDVILKTKNRLMIVDSNQSDPDIHSSLDYINLAESVLNRANFEHRIEK